MTGSYSAGIKSPQTLQTHYIVYPTYENANGNGYKISPGKNDDTTAWEWKVTFLNLNFKLSSAFKRNPYFLVCSHCSVFSANILYN